MLEYRMRLYLLGHHMRWLVLVVAAGIVTWGSPEERAQASLMYTMIAFASLYNLALWVIPWKRFEEEGRGNLIAVPYVVADTICMGIVVYTTGGISSNMYIVYLMLVVWIAMYPGTREHYWLWVIVVASYAVAVFLKDVPTGQMIYAFLMRATIFGFVAWLAHMSSHELNSVYSRLESAMRDLTDGVVVLDREGRVLLMNPRSTELLGVAQADALNRRIADDAAPASLAPLRKLVAPAGETLVDDSGAIHSHEVVLGESRQRVLRVYTVPCRDDDGVGPGEMKVIHDVTNLKELDRLRSEFMSALTHDLCNPLHTVKTILRVFRMRTQPSLDAENERMLHSIEEHMDRLIRLTREMLDAARVEAGTLELNVEEVDLGDAVSSVVDATRWDAQARGIELREETAEALTLVRGDRDRLVRVIYNLIENAVKFTPPGGAITVSTAATPAHDGMALVSVCDTGPGIALEQTEMIFDRFVRAGDELALKTRGAGLGLPICRELINAHGGRLWVESTLGEGSRFHFTVPLASE